MAKKTLRVIPLGGLGEIGKNMMALEYGSDIVVVDCGVMFPTEEMLGVDLVIPDIAYLIANKDKVRGIILTHGHEDHIGALPYVLNELKVPVYGTRLTLGLAEVRIKERKIQNVKLNVVEPREEFRLGQFKVTPFRVNHSIPDAVGYILDTPLGKVIHTGDFKLDHTPVDGVAFDLDILADAGRKGVLLLMSDSTYAETPGYTPSEKVIESSFDTIIMEAKGRVIVASFASLISRIQQVVNAAAKHGRVVAVAGRSMVSNTALAREMGYLHVPDGVLKQLHEIRRLPPEKVVLMTTGAQGEPTSALVRIANGDHREVKIQANDTVIISANPIPGNEKLVARTIDSLFKAGANVFYTRLAEVHTRGHASQEELKLILSLTKPQFFVPVHGDFRHLVLHTRIAHAMGMPKERTFTLLDGDVLELDRESGQRKKPLDYETVYVDGANIGDISQVILRDRKHLSEDGVVVVILAFDGHTGRVIGNPDIVSRGFAAPDGGEELWVRTRQVVQRAIDQGKEHPSDLSYVHQKVRESVANFIYQETKQRPLILPVALEL
jgi:ribonuclease J